MTEDLGKKPMEIISDSLDKFAEPKEMQDLTDTLSAMMCVQEDSKQEAKKLVDL